MREFNLNNYLARPSGNASPYDKFRELNPDVFNPVEVNVPRISKYDYQGLLMDPENPMGSVEEHRGQLQPTSEKWTNAATKAGVLALTTFTDAFIGTAAGLVNSAATGFEKGSFSNNLYTQAMKSIQDWSEESLPNYYTKSEREASLFGKLGTANFWADGVLKNTGFAIGALTAAMVGNEVAFSKLFGTAKEAKKFFSLIAEDGDDLLKQGLTSKSGKILRSEEEVLNAMYSNDLNLEGFRQSVLESAKKLNRLSLPQKTVAAAFGAQGEARFEAINTYQETKDKAIQEYINDYKQRTGQDITPDLIPQNVLKGIENQARTASNVDFALNLPILTIGDMMQFGRYLGRGFKTEKDVAEKLNFFKGRIAGDLKEGYKLGEKTIGSRISTGVKMIKNPIAEGTEEQLQLAAQYGSEDYAQRKYDGDGSNIVSDFVQGIATGIGKAYGTQEGWENFLIGALSTGIGTPTFGMQGKWFAGGIPETVKDYRREEKFVKNTIESLNKNKDKFQTIINGAVTHQSYEKDKENALEKNDIFNYNNADAAQLTNMVMMLHDLGRYDEVAANIKSLKNITEDQLKEQYIIKTDKDGKQLPENEWIRPFENKPEGQLQKEFHERLDNIQKQADKIVENKEAVETKWGSQLSQNEKNQLVFDLSFADNLDQRTQDIVKKLSEKGYQDGRTVAELTEDFDRLFKSTEVGKKWVDGYKKLKEKEVAILKRQEDGRMLMEEMMGRQNREYKQGKTFMDETIERQQKKVEDLGKELSNVRESITSLKKEAFNRHKEVVEKLGDIQGLAYPEFEQQVEQLIDKQFEFNERSKNFFKRNPQLVEELSPYITDLEKIQNLRSNVIHRYVKNIDSLRNGKNLLANSEKKALDNIYKRILERKLKRFADSAKRNKRGVDLFNKETGKKVKFLTINDKYFINDEGVITEVELNEDFANNYVFDREVEKVQNAEKTDTSAGQKVDEKEFGKTSYTDGDKVLLGGKIVKYKDKEYVAIPFSENQYKLFFRNDQGELSHDGFVVDKMNTTLIDPATKQYQFEGKAVFYKGQKGLEIYLVKDLGQSILDRFEKVQPNEEKINEEDLENLNEEEEEDYSEKPQLQIKIGNSFKSIYTIDDIFQKIIESKPTIFSELFEGLKNKKYSVKLTIDGKEVEVKLPPYDANDDELPTKINIKYLVKRKGKFIKRKGGKGLVTSYKNYTITDPEVLKTLKFRKIDGVNVVEFTDEDGKKQYGELQWKEKENEDIELYQVVGKEKNQIWWGKDNLKMSLRTLLNRGGKILKDQIKDDFYHGVEVFRVPVEFTNLKGEKYTKEFFVFKPKKLTNKEQISTKYKALNFFVKNYNSLKNIITLNNGQPVIRENETKENVETQSESKMFNKTPLPVFHEGVLFTTTDSYWLRKNSEVDGKVQVDKLVENMKNASSPQEKANIRYELFTSRFNVFSNYIGKVLELTAEEVGALDDNRNPLFTGKGKFMFITNKNGKFVNENGEVIENNDAISKGIYTSVREPNFSIRASEEDKSKFTIVDSKNRELVAPHSNKEQLEKEIDMYKMFYSTISEGDELEIKGKLQGVPVYGNEYVPSEQVLKDLDYEIQLSTLGNIDINGLSYKVKKGHVYAVNKKTGDIIELQPRKVNDEEITTILSLLDTFVSRIDKDGRIPEDAAKVEVSVASKERAELGLEGGTEIFDLFKDGIEQIVYMQSKNNLPKEAYEEIKKVLVNLNEEYKKLIPLGLNDKSAFKASLNALRENAAREIQKIQEQNIENKYIKTQFYLMNNMFFQDEEGHNHFINVGGEVYNLVDENGKIPQETKEAIIEFLKTRNIQFSSKLVSNDTSDRVKKITKASIENNELKVEGKTIVNGKEYIKDNSVSNQVVNNEVPSRVSQSLLLNVSVPEMPKEESKEEEKSDLSRFVGKKFGLTDEAKEKLKETLAGQKKEENEEAEQGTDISSLMNKKESDTSDISIDEDTPFKIANKDKYVQEDLNKAEQWLKEKFGDKVDFKIVKKLIDNKAWGAFQKAAIYIYENAEVGTTYHEAYHAVERMFLSPIQRKALHTEVRNRKSNKGKNLSDKKIEEILAEEFRDYVLSEGKIKPEAPIQKNWFQRLLDFIKSIVGIKSVNEIFERINTGYYSDINPHMSLEEKVYSPIGNRDYTYTQRIMDGYNFYFMGNLFRENKNLLYDLFSSKGLNRKDLQVNFEGKKMPIFEVVKTSFERKRDALQKAGNPAWEEIQYALDNWTKVSEKYVEYLKQYSLDLNLRGIEEEGTTEETLNEGKDETQREGGRGNEYTYDSLKVSTKQNASKIIKLYIGTLAKTKQVEEIKDGKKVIKNVSVLNEFGLPTMVDFGETFSLLTNKLSSHVGISELKRVLEELSLNESLTWVPTLIARLHLNKNIDTLSFNEVNTLIQFTQTFSRNKNNFTTVLMDSEGDTELIDSNANSLNSKIKNKWEHDSLFRAFHNDKYITKDKNGISYNSKKLKEDFGVLREDKHYIDFLHAIGLNVLEMPLEKSDADELKKRTLAIHKDVISGKQPFIFTKTTKSDKSEDLRTIITIHSKNPKVVDTIENGHYNLNGDLVYDATLYGYTTYIISKLTDLRNKLLREGRLSEQEFFNELYVQYPFFGDPYLSSSNILKNFIKTGRLEMQIVEGSRERSFNKGKSFSDLSTPDRLRIWFNNHTEGIYVMARPSDNGQERFFETGHLISRERTIAKDYVFGFFDEENNTRVHGFYDYLKDEINARTSYKRNKSVFQKVNKNIYRGIIIDLLKQNSFLYNSVIEAIDSGKTDVINSIEFKKEFDKLIVSYINTQVNNNINLFERNLLIQKNGDTWKNYGLTLKEGTVLIQQELENQMLFFTVNTMFSQIEQSKLFFGDLIFSKTLVDKFKRNNGAVSTKKVIISNEINSWIENNMKRSDNAETLKQGNNRILRTIVLNDVTLNSDFIDEIQSVIKDKSGPYKKMDEGDGMSYISLDEWREFLFRSGDWSNDHENFYQYEMQIYLGNLVKQGKFEESKFKELFKHNIFGKCIIDGKVIEKKDIHIKANSLKIQYYGPMANVEGFKGTMYKTSVATLIPSIWMDENGTVKFPNLFKLDLLMRKKQTGIVSHYSANKGLTTQIDEKNKFYNDSKTREFNSSDPIVQDTYYEFWGIQVDTGFKSHHDVVTGTQMLKQIWNNLYDEGEPLNEELDVEVKELFHLNSERIRIGKELLKKKLGLKETSEGYEYSGNSDYLKDSLKDEALKRNMPDNIIDAIDFIDFGLGVEPIISREKIENILFSIADKMTISRKTNGKPAYQVAPTLFETHQLNETKTKEGNKEYLTSNRLRFYHDEDGKLSKMEVYLPSWFKGQVPIGELDKNLISLIGFRIPTQGLNSIESIIVKDFLPDTLGDVIIVPTEIVAKAGSDYDIDKMNLYIPNSYMKDGVPVFIERMSQLSEYNDSIKNESKKLSEDEFAIKVIENQMMLRMHSIILHPHNRYQLLVPNSSESLKNIQWEITALEKGIRKSDFSSEEEYNKAVKKVREEAEENTSFNKFMEVEFMNDVTKQNMEGKGGVGITALASTFKIIAAKHGFTLNETFNNGKEDIITTIHLPHNKKNGLVSLGGNKDKEGQFIWEALSEYISASVDNAKELILKALNSGTQTLNTVLYLKMAGVPTRVIHYFMKQPIISEYIRLQEIYESQNSEVNDLKKQLGEKGSPKDNLIKHLKQMFNTNYTISEPDIKLEQLEEAIYNNGKGRLSERDKALQLRVLEDFINYQETAKIIGNAVQAINYDTKSYGKNVSELLYRLRLKDRVSEVELINNFKSALNEDSFLKPYKDALEDLEKTYEPLFITLQNKVVLNEFKNVLKKFTSGNINLPADRLIDILDRWKQSFISYCLTAKPSLNNKAFNLDKDTLFKGENSVPNKIARIQQILQKGDNNVKSLTGREAIVYSTYSSNTLVRGLQPIFPENEDYHYLYFHSKRFDKIEANQFTQDWHNMLNNTGDSLGLELAKFVFLQSGIQNSPMNFINFVPSKFYGDIMNRILTGHEVKFTEAEMSNFTNQFYIHNYDNDDLVPEGYRGRKPRGLNIDIHPFYKRKVLKPGYEKQVENLSWKARADKIREWKANGERPYESVPKLFFTAPYLKQIEEGKSPVKEYSVVGFNNRRDFRENKSLLDYKNNEQIAVVNRETIKTNPELETLDCPIPFL